MKKQTLAIIAILLLVFSGCKPLGKAITTPSVGNNELTGTPWNIAEIDDTTATVNFNVLSANQAYITPLYSMFKAFEAEIGSTITSQNKEFYYLQKQELAQQLVTTIQAVTATNVRQQSSSFGKAIAGIEDLSADLGATNTNLGMTAQESTTEGISSISATAEQEIDTLSITLAEAPESIQVGSEGQTSFTLTNTMTASTINENSITITVDQSLEITQVKAIDTSTGLETGTTTITGTDRATISFSEGILPSQQINIFVTTSGTSEGTASITASFGTEQTATTNIIVTRAAMQAITAAPTFTTDKVTTGQESTIVTFTVSNPNVEAQTKTMNINIPGIIIKNIQITNPTGTSALSTFTTTINKNNAEITGELPANAVLTITVIGEADTQTTQQTTNAVLTINNNEFLSTNINIQKTTAPVTTTTLEITATVTAPDGTVLGPPYGIVSNTGEYSITFELTNTGTVDAEGFTITGQSSTPITSLETIPAALGVSWTQPNQEFTFTPADGLAPQAEYTFTYLVSSDATEQTTETYAISIANDAGGNLQAQGTETIIIDWLAGEQEEEEEPSLIDIYAKFAPITVPNTAVIEIGNHQESTPTTISGGIDLGMPITDSSSYVYDTNLLILTPLTQQDGSVQQIQFATNREFVPGESTSIQIHITPSQTRTTTMTVDVALPQEYTDANPEDNTDIMPITFEQIQITQGVCVQGEYWADIYNYEGNEYTFVETAYATCKTANTISIPRCTENQPYHEYMDITCNDGCEQGPTYAFCSQGEGYKISINPADINKAKIIAGTCTELGITCDYLPLGMGQAFMQNGALFFIGRTTEEVIDTIEIFTDELTTNRYRITGSSSYTFRTNNMEGATHEDSEGTVRANFDLILDPVNYIGWPFVIAKKPEDLFGSDIQYIESIFAYDPPAALFQTATGPYSTWNQDSEIPSNMKHVPPGALVIKTTEDAPTLTRLITNAPFFDAPVARGLSEWPALITGGPNEFDSSTIRNMYCLVEQNSAQTDAFSWTRKAAPSVGEFCIAEPAPMQSNRNFAATAITGGATVNTRPAPTAPLPFVTLYLCEYTLAGPATAPANLQANIGPIYSVSTNPTCTLPQFSITGYGAPPIDVPGGSPLPPNQVQHPLAISSARNLGSIANLYTPQNTYGNDARLMYYCPAVVGTPTGATINWIRVESARSFDTQLCTEGNRIPIGSTIGWGYRIGMYTNPATTPPDLIKLIGKRDRNNNKYIEISPTDNMPYPPPGVQQPVFNDFFQNTNPRGQEHELLWATRICDQGVSPSTAIATFTDTGNSIEVYSQCIGTNKIETLNCDLSTQQNWALGPAMNCATPCMNGICTITGTGTPSPIPPGPIPAPLPPNIPLPEQYFGQITNVLPGDAVTATTSMGTYTTAADTNNAYGINPIFIVLGTTNAPAISFAVKGTQTATSQLTPFASTRLDLLYTPPGSAPAAPICGNGVIETGEQCEPPNTTTCDANCQTITLGAPAPTGPSCTDGIKNQDETAVDCGGTICPKCSNTKTCNINTDCKSGYCKNGICKTKAVPSSGGGGGGGGGPARAFYEGQGQASPQPTAPAGGGLGISYCDWICDEYGPCIDGMQTRECYQNTYPNCVDMPEPETTQVCEMPAPVIAPPSCADGIKNQGETYTDCGGPTRCVRCDPGLTCKVDSDCITGYCNPSSKLCSWPPVVEIPRPPTSLWWIWLIVLGAAVLGGGGLAIALILKHRSKVPNHKLKDLREYVSKYKGKVSDEKLRKKLASAGWKTTDIDKVMK